MEDRRCRKVMALLLTTVIILSVFVQNAYAAPEKSTERLFNRVMDLKQTILVDIVSDVREIVRTTDEKQVIKSWINKFSSHKEKELADRKNVEEQIIFVVEQNQNNDQNDYKHNYQVDKNNEKADKSHNKQVVKAVTASRSTGTNILHEDLEILARIIHAEARGESFEGQVAVGAVVLNRVQHPDFPKSIREVVYQPGQFTAVEDRQINLKPDDKAYQAAEAALEGQDPSNGAIFYYNPKIATDRWIKSRNIIRSIGNHKFCV